jgi:hypothetical protein
MKMRSIPETRVEGRGEKKRNTARAQENRSKYQSEYSTAGTRLAVVDSGYEYYSCHLYVRLCGCSCWETGVGCVLIHF